MRINLHLGDYGFIIRPNVSFDFKKWKIENIEGVLVDLPGPINPRLESVVVKGNLLFVKTSIKTVLIPLPLKVRSFMQDWKTTLLGLLGFIAISWQDIVAAATLEPGKINWSRLGVGVLAAAFGYFTADRKKKEIQK